MTIKVAINGYGRIGRMILRAHYEGGKKHDIEIVAINDLGSAETNAHLTRYDTAHGKFPVPVAVDGDSLLVGSGKAADRIKVFANRDPATLPWGQLGVDVVLECTGLFTTKEKASAHLKGGAKKVIISAPAKGEDLTIVLGVNEDKYDPAKHTVVSNASCTTNGLAPVAKVVNDSFGIVKGLMTTIHSYTNDQKILDQVHSDPRRARAAAMSIIPTTTGAARAVALVIPELKGKFHGLAMRVPTSTVSIIDFVANVGRKVTAEEVNAALKAAANGKMKGILEFCEEPLVSIDMKGNPASSIVDAESTMVIGDDMVKVLAWYDNEWGYSCRVADLAAFIAKKGI
jgi:glyceraldehyde 3-phosphate dehydrogenase